jgi:N-acetylglucosamine kinase-like BadF-type ATPase
MTFKIGVDGGGTKTECILVDETGTIAAIHVGTGCNPSVVGPEQARSIILAALESLRAEAGTSAGIARTPEGSGVVITSTLLCMAGSRAFWQEFAAGLAGFGKVTATDDSLPVLELATHSRPGLVLHAGTGSFIAARGPDGKIHYAGGLGWRFGDPGSGYDLGRRAVARALLELQGWAPPTRLGQTVREYTQLGAEADANAVTSFFYHHAEPNRQIAGLAPAVLRLASEGDHNAHQLITESAGELLRLAEHVGERIFSARLVGTVRAGLSGPLLTHPVVVAALTARSTLALAPVEGTPIEGVRRLLARDAG